MNSIIVVCILLILVQPIQTFCVYNNLTENAHMLVRQTRINVPVGARFAANIKQNEKECCHFSNKDCSPQGSDSDTVQFLIDIVQGNSVKTYGVNCTTGGGLSVYNFGDRRVAVCTHADGRVEDTPLVPF